MLLTKRERLVLIALGSKLTSALDFCGRHDNQLESIDFQFAVLFQDISAQFSRLSREFSVQRPSSHLHGMVALTLDTRPLWKVIGRSATKSLKIWRVTT